MSILDVINPIKALGDLANSLIGKFVTDPTEKAKLAAELQQAQDALTAKALDLQGQLTDAQAKVVLAETQSESWLPRNIRPLSLLVFLGVFVYQGIVASIFGLPPVNFSTVPSQLWTLFTVGFGGYFTSRGIEKSVANWKSNGNGSSN